MHHLQNNNPVVDGLVEAGALVKDIPDTAGEAGVLVDTAPDTSEASGLGDDDPDVAEADTIVNDALKLLDQWIHLYLLIVYLFLLL